MAEYAIFIEPDQQLSELILSEKRKLKKAFGHQEYLSHPPHSTLYFSEMLDIELWLSKLKEQIKELNHKSVAILIKDKFVFRNDILAGGGDTIVYKAELSKELLELQIQIGKTLRDFSLNKNKQHSFSGVLAKSYEEFGFPFLGDHWIPHFTLASIKDPESELYVQEFLSKSFQYEFEIDSISVWKVDGGSHNKVSEIRITA